MIEVCPVCQGRGLMPAGFYSSLGDATSLADETCRSCKGKGYIIVPPPDIYEVESHGEHRRQIIEWLNS